MNTEKLIDDFVGKINENPIQDLSNDEVTTYLITGGEDPSYVSKVLKKDCTAWIDALQAKLPNRLPPSYYSFVSRYAFPRLDIGPITFFANTGEKIYYEWVESVFRDRYLYPTLLANGLIEFGKYNYGYDPICFDCKRGKREHPIIRIDHEEVLIHERIKVIDEIAPSFIDFIKKYLKT